MEPEAFREMARTETSHWWFRARREILDRIIDSFALRDGARILEVGSGTGGNLGMLASHGAVSAFEMDDGARQMCHNKTGGRFSILPGQCPSDIPYKGQLFDLICMFDVLEHIDEDTETLAALRDRLSPNGRLLITVPAYQWLWGVHDIFLHHKRRYTAMSLKQALNKARLTVDRISYFNMFLLPLAALSRAKDKILSSDTSSGTATPPTLLNGTLFALFRSEKWLLTRFNLPAGVSLLCVARKERN